MYGTRGRGVEVLLNSTFADVEAEVRQQIDKRLGACGWMLAPVSTSQSVSPFSQDVFVERAVVKHLSSVQRAHLGGRSPDYSLLCDGVVVGLIEAKKPSVPIGDALAQVVDYAERLCVDFVFACNGVMTKSLHVPTGKPLRLNGSEVVELLSPVQLRRFREAASWDLVTVPQTVITSREQLMDVFERLNDVLRQAGVRGGVDRFTEFANILFLKLASEQGGSGQGDVWLGAAEQGSSSGEQSDSSIWRDLVTCPADDLPSYLNGFVLEKLRRRYRNDVLSPTKINGMALKQMVNELNPLHLTSVDEDVKGAAFEHFLCRTTGTNDLGEYFTPRPIVRLAVKMLNPRFGETVYDPFCGTGGFLIEAFRHLGQQVRHSQAVSDVLQRGSVFGTEITSTARIAKMNMILFGDGHSGVVQGDSLSHANQLGQLGAYRDAVTSLHTITSPSTSITSHTSNIPHTSMTSHTSIPRTYDNVLSNIPFSLDVDTTLLRAVDPAAKDADEACLLHCFHRLKPGGKMCVVIPEGLVVNRVHRALWYRLCNEARIRAIVMLPRDTFKPYTSAGTRLLYLTDKGRDVTDWYYHVNLAGAKAGPTVGLDEFTFFYQASDKPPADVSVPDGVDIVEIEHRADRKRFNVRYPWRLSRAVARANGDAHVVLQAKSGGTQQGDAVLQLGEVAHVHNGQTITRSTATPGDFPVIGGGRGTVVYTHNQANVDSASVTVSKSGAYAGYVWWHETPIWASDCIVVRSKDEKRFSSFYLYLCLRASQEELYGRQQGTGQPHVYQEQLTDFPVMNLTFEQQRSVMDKARLALQRSLQAQAFADEAMQHAVSVVNGLYSR